MPWSHGTPRKDCAHDTVACLNSRRELATYSPQSAYQLGYRLRPSTTIHTSGPDHTARFEFKPDFNPASFALGVRSLLAVFFKGYAGSSPSIWTKYARFNEF
ncbi:hypothetical protein CBOM_07662 [Ceraceosorus bombacis]|uniref:Uncharacterized protein n=1 Tax=Ceraceosorus bombacis TaxID=401625 RepID=A0A0P1BKT2_9BASI|nr:hypothetical protein CBOM_07662 [Ceraceosorus bombacis]